MRELSETHVGSGKVMTVRGPIAVADLGVTLMHEHILNDCAALGVTREDRDRPLPPSVLLFRDGMLTIARDGGYRDGVAIMLAAEWMYATWCSRAAKRAISNPILRRWVDLHAETEFLAQADWLRRQIDAADASDEASLGQHFRRALELEIAFHTAPFDGETR